MVQTDFSTDEFRARRAKVYEAIGAEAAALVRGSPKYPGHGITISTIFVESRCPTLTFIWKARTTRTRSFFRTRVQNVERVRARSYPLKTPILSAR